MIASIYTGVFERLMPPCGTPSWNNRERWNSSLYDAFSHIREQRPIQHWCLMPVQERGLELVARSLMTPNDSVQEK